MENKKRMKPKPKPKTKPKPKPIDTTAVVLAVAVSERERDRERVTKRAILQTSVTNVLVTSALLVAWLAPTGRQSTHATQQSTEDMSLCRRICVAGT